MRNLFAVNTDNESYNYDGHATFLRDSVPEYQTQRLEASTEQTVDLIQRTRLPLIVHIISAILLFLGVICLEVFGETLSEDITTPWPLLVAGILCIGIAVIVEIIQLRRTKRAVESDEGQLLLEQAKQELAQSKMLLGVPEDAADLDVLGYEYKIKRGKEKVIHDEYAYTANDLFAFLEEGELMLADAQDKYAIPLYAITQVECRRKKVKINSWNKEEEVTSAPYKPFKIRYDDENDVFTIRAVYALIINYNSEEYELLVPDYDWELVLQPLIGRQAVEV